mmetsp:Transcript_27601/g.67897  ORF Transcript_27601/g.67897 Transcript_27601/m.67897 type:complete len:453 (+) Transcript_27601:2749-4107(+)
MAFRALELAAGSISSRGSSSTASTLPSPDLGIILAARHRAIPNSNENMVGVITGVPVGRIDSLKPNPNDNGNMSAAFGIEPKGFTHIWLSRLSFIISCSSSSMLAMSGFTDKVTFTMPAISAVSGSSGFSSSSRSISKRASIENENASSRRLNDIATPADINLVDPSSFVAVPSSGPWQNMLMESPAPSGAMAIGEFPLASVPRQSKNRLASAQSRSTLFLSAIYSRNSLNFWMRTPPSPNFMPTSNEMPAGMNFTPGNFGFPGLDGSSGRLRNWTSEAEKPMPKVSIEMSARISLRALLKKVGMLSTCSLICLMPSGRPKRTPGFHFLPFFLIMRIKSRLMPNSSTDSVVCATSNKPSLSFDTLILNFGTFQAITACIIFRTKGILIFDASSGLTQSPGMRSMSPLRNPPTVVSSRTSNSSMGGNCSVNANMPMLILKKTELVNFIAPAPR